MFKYIFLFVVSPSKSLLHLSLYYLYLRDFSKPFFGKIAQAPHYTNLVGIQIMKLKKIN